MEWLAENWIWVIVAVAFFGVHMLGHGSHGGHGGHGGHDDESPARPKARGDGGRKPERPTDRSGHVH